MIRFAARFALHLLLACAASTPALAQRWVTPAEAGHRIDGAWRAQGYGQVLVFENRRPSIYHVAGSWCYRDPDPAAGRDEMHRLVSVETKDRIAFASAPGQTRYVFDRIAALPAACRIARRWTPAQIGQLVAATFGDLYPGFGTRGRTKPALIAALATLPAGSDDAMLYDRLTRTFEALDDAHVGLTATVGGSERTVESGEAPTILAARADAALGADPAARERSWSQRYRAGIVALLDGGGHHVANRRILWGRIGTIGYINIVSMGGFSADAPPDDITALDTALDAALAAFAGLPGVIVDVTNNRGGYDAVGLHLARRFASERVTAFAKRAVGASVPFQLFHVEPSPRIRYTGAVTLLTSDITVSAAETFTLAMRALPNVRHVGARTRGALSDQLAKPLPNGWTLTLPAEIYRDADGRSDEGVGITPVSIIAPFAPSHAATLTRLAAEMRAASQATRRLGCRPKADRDGNDHPPSSALATSCDTLSPLPAQKRDRSSSITGASNGTPAQPAQEFPS